VRTWRLATRKEAILPLLGVHVIAPAEDSLGDLLHGKHRDKSTEFYLKEYECIRKEVELLIQDSRIRGWTRLSVVVWALLLTATAVVASFEIMLKSNLLGDCWMIQL
jgi:hypothetical protein